MVYQHMAWYGLSGQAVVVVARSFAWKGVLIHHAYYIVSFATAFLLPSIL